MREKSMKLIWFSNDISVMECKEQKVSDEKGKLTSKGGEQHVR